MENKKTHSLCLEAFLMCQNMHRFKYSVTLGIFDGKIGNVFTLPPYRVQKYSTTPRGSRLLTACLWCLQSSLW